MQLSILIATNRAGLLPCSRIAQACSWASPNLQVVIRDNSGNAEKRDFLAQCRRENCTIVIAEPCDALTNFNEGFRLTTGDFVFLLADDDFCFDHAIPAVSSMIDKFGKDPSTVGVTGAYAVETSQGTSILSYNNIDSDNVAARVSGYLQFGGPNIMHYAPVRREIVERVFGFMSTMPGLFSFHDQIICLLYLLHGKFAPLKRLLYLYDIGVWENSESGQRRDLDFYVAAGFDPAINALHWFLCGFEGAVLVRNADLFPDFPLAQRQIVADVWFSAMFGRFKSHQRVVFESRFNDEAEIIRAKLLQSTGRLSFQDLLAEVRDFISVFSATKAQSYYEFWDAMINRRKRQAPLPKALAENHAP